MTEQEKVCTTQQDDPANITFGHLYKDVKVGFSDIDPAKITPMLCAYFFYRNKGIRAFIHEEDRAILAAAASIGRCEKQSWLVPRFSSSWPG
jgi:hypothetical protein